jgi:hypothetical protein
MDTPRSHPMNLTDVQKYSAAQNGHLTSINPNNIQTPKHNVNINNVNSQTPKHNSNLNSTFKSSGNPFKDFFSQTPKHVTTNTNITNNNSSQKQSAIKDITNPTVKQNLIKELSNPNSKHDFFNPTPKHVPNGNGISGPTPKHRINETPKYRNIETPKHLNKSFSNFGGTGKQSQLNFMGTPKAIKQN